MSKAMELILLARRMTASEALQYGIVHEVVPVGQSIARAKALATKMMEAGPIALRQAKLAIRGGMDRPLDQALQWEVERYKDCLYSKDRIEGLKSFAEKRKPQYTGQ